MTVTLQCLSEHDRKLWLEVMEGKEPIYMESNELKQIEGVTRLDETGMQFVTKCMEGIEKRGLQDQGIYRIAGVGSKFNKLLMTGIDPKQVNSLDLESEDSTWEVKTITSAMKQYFRYFIPLPQTLIFSTLLVSQHCIDSFAPSRVSKLQDNYGYTCTSQVKIIYLKLAIQLY